ncbi:hydrophobin [Flammula alnicola]|nr:hydrophobin [Flammula alnicola]
MFSKAALLITAAFAASAIATPAIYSSCNSGPVQCCGALHEPNTAAATDALGLVNVVLSSVSGQVGVECNPITGIGAGTGANCASSPVCCEQNFFNQGVGVNCSPVTVRA